MTRIHLCIVLLLFQLTGSVSRGAGNWPQWRGPQRDALSTESGLLQEWPENGPPLLWQAEGLGEGYSTIAVQGERLFTMGVDPFPNKGKGGLIQLS